MFVGIRLVGEYNLVNILRNNMLDNHIYSKYLILCKVHSITCSRAITARHH